MKKLAAIIIISVLLFSGSVAYAYTYDLDEAILDWLFLLLPEYISQYGTVTWDGWNGVTNLDSNNVTLTLPDVGWNGVSGLADANVSDTLTCSDWTGWNGVTNLGDANVSSLNASKIVSGTFDGTYTITGDLNMDDNKIWLTSKSYIYHNSTTNRTIENILP